MDMLKVDKLYIGTEEEIVSFLKESFFSRARVVMKGRHIDLPNMDSLRNTDMSLEAQIKKVKTYGSVIYWDFENMNVIRREHKDGEIIPFLKLKLKSYNVQILDKNDVSESYLDELTY